MRSQALLRPARSLAKKRATPSTRAQRILLASSNLGFGSLPSQASRIPPRRDSARPPSRAASKTSRRASSSSTPSSIPFPSDETVVDGSELASYPPSPSAPPEEPPAVPPEDEPEADTLKSSEAGEKVKRTRRPRVVDVSSKEEDAPSLPAGLEVLWTPDSPEPAPSSTAIPPAEILNKALLDFLITQHPQTQHRAAYPSATGPPIEPTLALYCPIEGGDYVIDETVRNLARSTDSDVIVLDSVQLAAGEWGAFGKAASVIQLPQNPLHFHHPSSRSSSSPFGRPPFEDEPEEDDDHPGNFGPAAHMTLHVLTPEARTRSGRQSILAPAPRGSSASKIKAFFDELINMPAPGEAEAIQQGKRRSRIIYIRDYPTLAASASSWYPSLLASVRQRRQGPISRPSSPVANSVTIVFGITPPIVQPPPSGHGGPQGILGLVNGIINARHGSPAVFNGPAKKGRHDYGEDELSEKAREKRFRERLRRWERDDQAFLDDLPRLAPTPDPDSASSDRPGIVIVGAPGMSGGMSPAMPPAMSPGVHTRASNRGDEGPDNSRFFRVSVLVPTVRNLSQERSCRVDRRKEINELTMRMGVGAVGGRIEGDLDLELLLPEALSSSEDPHAHKPPDVDPEQSGVLKMWDEWGKSVETWTNVKAIADRAVGSVVAQRAAESLALARLSLEHTPISWAAVTSAWAAHHASKDVRKAWVQESAGRFAKDAMGEGEEGAEQDEAAKQEEDNVIQRIREDTDLTPHEQRLLGCIVDSASMPTSFSQVHLPPHTIDSVRTMVSLPLLYPAAFQQGILKQHSMTGCLLFGPPGTGKTLVVRALAKEAGCRMLAVQPSDVMDMYVGEGEKLVRSVFSLARRLSPCVIFLDEIDALFGARSSARESGGALAHHGVITEFMQEMDGLKTNRDTNVIVIGATNRPFDLDDAVLRRLPRRLLVDLPGEKEREAILKILLRDETLASDVDLTTLARHTKLFSGSDLKHLCVSAALDAVKEGVTLPWATPKADASEAKGKKKGRGASATQASSSEPGVEQPSENAPNTSEQDQPLPEQGSTSESPPKPRILYLRHFNKALKEITPSSSESLGSLAALRKWNEEFGEGQKKKRKIIWGKGSFGFVESGADAQPFEGHVSAP